MTSLNNIRINGTRLWQSIMDIAEIGPGEQGGSCRLALTDEDKSARDLFCQWCIDAGCSITIDDMGNIFARRSGIDNTKLPIATGSHLDTQPHGGKFDGIYGVLAGLEVFRSLDDANITTDAPLEIVVWTNEEGSRFAPAMIGSGVFSGLFEKDFAWTRSDGEGVSMLDELKRIDYFGEQVCGDHPLGALFEVHIEQGPVLEANEKQIGVVHGGQGMRWYDIEIKGKDSHAGPTPMSIRQDALVAAAEIITSIQKIALDRLPHSVSTVGEMHVIPNSRNTIPGIVNFTVDLRNPDNTTLSEMDQEFRYICEQCKNSHGVEIEINEIWTKAPVHFNKNCISAVTEAVAHLELSNMDMVSGAGHDACQVCEIVPTSMIFIPCEDGLSHNELESAEPEDIEAGANVLLHSMIALAK